MPRFSYVRVLVFLLVLKGPQYLISIVRPEPPPPPGLPPDDDPATPQVAPLTLRGVPPSISAEEVRRRIKLTYDADPEVKQVIGQPPGNFALRFREVQTTGGQACT